MRRHRCRNCLHQADSPQSLPDEACAPIGCVRDVTDTSMVPRKRDEGPPPRPALVDEELADQRHAGQRAYRARGGGADLGAVFVEVVVVVADPVQPVLDAQWPRMMAASWTQVAWMTVSEVTASQVSRDTPPASPGDFADP
jgi:hypothetical protein